MSNSVGIIILNYNTYDETVVCVRSIREKTTIPFHIYVVDNNSSDNSGKKLEKTYDSDNDVSVILNAVNSGYSAGNNVGIKEAVSNGHKYIAIVNSDVEILNDAFKIMIETLKSDDDIMIVGPSVINNDKVESQILRKRLTFKTFLLDRHPICDILRRKENEPDRYYSFSDVGVTKADGSVCGCCFCISAEDFRSIHYFDENVFLYYEEDIIAYKMLEKQKLAAVNADAKIWHKENISTNKRGSAFVQFHRWTSVLYLLKKYAKVSKLKQTFIALWNILTWDMLSIGSIKYRNMNRDFRHKNWSIVRIDDK